MDTVIRKHDPRDGEQDKAEPRRSETADEMSAFMASEDFTPFVLDCLKQAARDAVAEQATLAVGKRRDE